MVKVRLALGGAKKKPFYAIVASDVRKRRDSGYIEKIGFFNPVAKGQEERLRIEIERLDYWRSQGAQLSDRVKQLVKEFNNPEIYAKKLAKMAKREEDETAKRLAAEKAKLKAAQIAAQAATDEDKTVESLEQADASENNASSDEQNAEKSTK